MLISVRKHVIVYEYEEAYVLRGLLHYYSDQKFLIEKTKMRNHKTGTLLLSSTFSGRTTRSSWATPGRP